MIEVEVNIPEYFLIKFDASNIGLEGLFKKIMLSNMPEFHDTLNLTTREDWLNE